MSAELPITSDYTRRRGDTKPIKFTVKDEDGALVDMTGYSFVLTVDSTKEPADEVTKQFASTGSTPSTGIVSFPFATNDVDLLGTYYYDAQMTDPLGVVTTIAAGKIKFKQDITK